MAPTESAHEGGGGVAKIRHIAIRAQDVEQTAKLFTEVFGLELVQRRAHGPIDLSDGDVNITLLPLRMGGREDEERPGYSHIGFTVEDQDAVKERLLDKGARELNPVNLGEAYYESKYQSAEGLVIDVGHWRGTSPISEEAAAAI
jgi:catechol 2,3-dioxygenase-like lactoylglutathione lyase family enzyme